MSGPFTNRPQGSRDAYGSVAPDSFTDRSFRGEYAGVSNLIYKAFARPGALETDPVWQIAFQTHDVNGNVTSILYAQDPRGVATNTYIFKWSDRLIYTYS